MRLRKPLDSGNDCDFVCETGTMISQSNYWTRHGRDIAKTGEWFHKTTEQWAMETGLMLSHALHLTC